MADFTGTSSGETISGTAGADNMTGLGGDDTYVVNNVADAVFEAIDGGSDRVLASVSWVLTAGSYVERLTTNDNLATTAINLTGNALSQFIYGNAGANTLDGGGGGDVLVGLGGDDFYYIRNAADRVVEAAGGGYDRVFAAANFTLEAGSEVEKFTTVDNLATTAINLTGNALAQFIYGNAGSNILDGGGGGDVMAGLEGDDFYYIRNATDRVVEAAGAGYDRVFAAANFTLEAGSEVEKFTTVDNLATTAINLTGNSLAQFIYGNAGSNILDGGGGGDVMAGLEGDDFYYIRNAADRVVEAVGAGYDRVFAAANFTLEAGSEVEKFTTIDNLATTAINLTGNSLAQFIYGNAGSNILDGGGGGDVMAGLEGDDFYYIRNVADRVVEAAGGGNDRIFAAASFTLEAGSALEIFTTVDNLATTAINLTGNAIAQYIYGNAGANILDGGGGADVLSGLGGADTFVFSTTLGAGNIGRIADFEVNADFIRLGGAAGQPFAALASGALSAASFVIGTQALQADDYIVYNSTTGALSFDADGNGAGAAVQFATLGTGLALTAANFTVSGPANNAPAVTSGTTASVAENTAASTVVYTATATDADGDRVTWSLGGTDASQLSIDAVTGQVRLLSPADFETRTSYSFSVIASDSGTAGSRAVTLSVTDVNENSSTPIIPETAAANNSTGTAQAIDRGTFVVSANADLPNQALPSGTITGSISANTDVDFFSITLQAGEQLILDLDHSTGGLNSVVRVYNPAGTELGFNDDLVSFDAGSVPTIASHNTDSYVSFRATTAGTYYFSVESYGPGIDNGPGTGTSSGNYSLNVSIGPPATQAQIINEDIDALISGAQWLTHNLRYGFPTLTSQYPAGIEETDSPSDNFQPFSPNQQAVVTAQLGLIAQVTTLVFTLETNNYFDAHLRYAMSDEAEVAYAYYPPSNGAPGGIGGSAWFNNTDGEFDNPVLGNYDWMGILHETGHALGLKHGHEFPAVSPDRDSVEYTVMTYRSYPGQSIAGGYSNETWGFPQSLMMYDIAALQRIYGANYATNAGNSIYTFSTTTGEMSINGVGTGVPGANRVFRTIWDGGGTDTYDLSAYSNGVTIDLRPGEWSQTSSAQLAGLGGGHMARGNFASALMFEGNTASLIENAIGGSGGDTLIANQVANQLRGNAGADTFKWMAAGDAGTGALSDTILDFAAGDKIDLSGMDAISGTGANDAFTFLGAGAFTNVAGQLRYENGHIFGDIDGNGVADFDIVVTNAPALVANDFML